MEVSKATANYFYQQCAGEYTGHMSMVPNNPNLYGLVQAHGAMSPIDFAEFLAQISKHLKDTVF